QEGNGEHAEQEFFRDGGQKSAEQHVCPGELRVEQIGVGHVRRRPGAETVSHDVKRRLVRDEDAAQRKAQNRAEQERLRSHAAQPEEIAQRKLVGKELAVERLRGGRQEKKQAAGRECGEDILKRLA